MTTEEKLTCRKVDARLRGASFPEIFKALKQSSEMKLSYQQVWGQVVSQMTYFCQMRLYGQER
jgi:hypothetical protein